MRATTPSKIGLRNSCLSRTFHRSSSHSRSFSPVRRRRWEEEGKDWRRIKSSSKKRIREGSSQASDTGQMEYIRSSRGNSCGSDHRITNFAYTTTATRAQIGYGSLLDDSSSNRHGRRAPTPEAEIDWGPGPVWVRGFAADALQMLRCSVQLACSYEMARVSPSAAPYLSIAVECGELPHRASLSPLLSLPLCLSVLFSRHVGVLGVPRPLCHSSVHAPFLPELHREVVAHRKA